MRSVHVSVYLKELYIVRRASRLLFLAVLILLIGELAGAMAGAATPVLGTKKVVVLRVYFQDYQAVSRYTLAEVQGFYANLDQLWRDTSYDHIDVMADISALFQLPDNCSDYIDNSCTGNLSSDGKFTKVLTDAIANSPGTVNWSNVDAVHVLMAETNPLRYHRGQARIGGCNLRMGPGGAEKLVGCAIFSENPKDNDLQVWGRWAHEIGHSFQAGGPPHPSNYNNEFELMDSNYPGQTGVFEKQDHVAFPGWMPVAKYQVFTPTSGGGAAALWAMEYDPAGKPNAQAAKVEITGNLYYLLSVRRAVVGG